MATFRRRRRAPFFAAAGAPDLSLELTGSNAFDPRITFGRVSTAPYRDTTGTIQTAASGEARLDHDASGNALGLLIEEARTNRALHSRDLTNVAWTKTNGTAAKDQEGADGAANAASSFEATSANGTVTQSITDATSRARAGSFLVKRLVGSGTIEITLDGGSTWTDVTSQVDSGSVYANGFYRISGTQTLAGPEIGIRLATSGDKIAVDYAQCEDGTFVTSVIPTTTATVTRAAESCYILTSAFAYNDGGAGTAFCEINNLHTFSFPQPFDFVDISNLSTKRIQIYMANLNPNFRVNDVTQQASIGIGGGLTIPGVNKLAASWEADRFQICANGTLGTADTSGSIPEGITRVGIGERGDSNDHLNGHLLHFRYWNRRLSDVQLQSLTS